MTMDIGGELLAPMCLITTDGGSESLSLGIDLGALGLDFAAVAEFASDASIQSMEAAEISTSPLTAEISALLGQKQDNNEDDKMPLEGLDDLLEGLDFEVSDDVWMAISNTDPFAGSSMMDSSPLNDTPDYSSVAMNSPPGSMLTSGGYSSNMAASPAACSDDADLDDDDDSPSPGSDSTEPRLKRTRARTIDKKQSNKAAATKYRTKKVHEKETLFAECADFERKNGELKRLIDDAQTEISFIKSLLVEALIAKNVAKSS